MSEDADAGADAAEESEADGILDRLDGGENLGAPDAAATDPAPLSRQEIDRLVDRALDEELRRLSGSAPRPKG